MHHGLSNLLRRLQKAALKSQPSRKHISQGCSQRIECFVYVKQADVDDIHERLLTVAVEAVSVHGGKDQEEREEAIQLFKAGKKVYNFI